MLTTMMTMTWFLLRWVVWTFELWTAKLGLYIATVRILRNLVKIMSSSSLWSLVSDVRNFVYMSDLNLFIISAIQVQRLKQQLRQRRIFSPPMRCRPLAAYIGLAAESARTRYSVDEHWQRRARTHFTRWSNKTSRQAERGIVTNCAGKLSLPLP